MYNHNLFDLLYPLVGDLPNSLLNYKFHGITLDSRDVSTGDLFISIPGYLTKGHFYIKEAISRGASIVLSQSIDKYTMGCIDYCEKIPILYIDDLNKLISSISGILFHYPSLFLRLVGVTGTNGKTSVTHLLSNWIMLMGEISAVMGTIGNGIFDNISPSIHTTSSAIEIQRSLIYFKEKGVTFVAIEVSSHGLIQYRVEDLYFDVAIFTNLSRDHLDYHRSMMHYESAKWKLFNSLKVKEYVINADDTIGKKWLVNLPNAVAVIITGVLPSYWEGRWLKVIKIHYCFYYTNIIFNSSWGCGIINTKLIGTFNVINLVLAMTTLLVLGYPLSLLLNTAYELSPICGRMELFNNLHYPKVIIDYAHTPDALRQALISSRLYCAGKLWCIFGCGGDRDRGKRPLMGIIASSYADVVIITSDNSRNENTYDIINEINSKIINKNKIKIIVFRDEAIKFAIYHADITDVILIAGKGHEDYQIIDNEVFNYSDRNIVKKILFNNK